MEKESFDDLLSRFRKRRGLTQKQLANSELELSSSYIAMLENGQRGFLPTRKKSRPLTRKQVWHLVQKLDLWPTDLDRFLESAGQSGDRSKEEEIDLQRRPLVRELWVFARHILDPEPEWCDIVATNMLNGVTYRYFTSNDAAFYSLLLALRDRVTEKDKQVLQDRIECNLLPTELFITNFAIYNPGTLTMYGCGTKIEYGRAERFYSMHESEVQRLYELLSGWRNRLNAQIDIPLSDARRIHPDPLRSKFCALE
jgi:transcriptional regulator with XRE-family HTH domain